MRERICSAEVTRGVMTETKQKIMERFSFVTAVEEVNASDVDVITD